MVTNAEVGQALGEYFAYPWEKAAVCKLCGALVDGRADHIFLLMHLRWHRHLDEPHAAYAQVTPNTVLDDLILESRERLRGLGL